MKRMIRTTNLFSTINYKVTCRFDGKQFFYENEEGKQLRKGKIDFKFACVAETVKNNGYSTDGKLFVIAFGNKRESTMQSMAHCYPGCNLHVIEIEKI